MTTEQEQQRRPEQPETVSRRGFVKAAAAVAASTTVAASIGILELRRSDPASHLVARRVRGDVPLDPDDPAWARLRAWRVPMRVQNLTTPSVSELAVSEISVRAAHNGQTMAFRIEWDDADEDNVDAMARFRDAVAVQLPVDPTAPVAVTMGAPTQPVHIMQWRAAWQVDVDQGRRGVHDAFPNMYHDAPPEALMGEEAARQFYPALVAGNPMARRDRTSPVEDLVAEGFGSLTAHAEQTATGRGVFTRKGWRVVIATPLQPGADKTSLASGITTNVAFAVWNGSHGTGARGSSGLTGPRWKSRREMTTPVSHDVLARPQVQSLLGRSALYEALALSLAEPQPEVLERLDALLRDLATHPVVSSLGIAREARGLRQARKDIDAEQLAPVHFVLFEASVLCSPHETEYVRDPFAKAAQLADIAGFYAAFGLRVSAQHPTTPDDICTELEFVALATRREAYALVQGWEDRAGVCRDAWRSFLESHLGRWFEAFSVDLRAQAGPAAATRDDPAAAAWFRAVADLVRLAVQADLNALGIYPSRLHSRVVNDDSEAWPSCPMVTGESP